MGMLRTFAKWKRIIIIIVVVLVVLLIIRMFRLKKDVLDMLKKELHLADSVSKARSSNTSSTEDSLVSFLSKASRLVKLDGLETIFPDDPGLVSDDNDKFKIKEDSKKPNREAVRRKGSKTSSYKREEICRGVLEEYFDDYFPTCRPKFLTNPETGRALELDGYNPAKSLAFEHHGKQHYEYPNAFHKTEEEFLKQKERDEFKKQRCAELQIALLEIPYTVPTENLKEFIVGELKRLGY